MKLMKKQTASEFIGFRCTPRFRKKLEKAAKANNVVLSEFVKHAIYREIKSVERKEEMK